jgi:uncharacterized protein (UPF0305 family)
MQTQVLKDLTIIEDLRRVKDRQSLLEVLREGVGRYSVFDLVSVQGVIAQEIKYLPSPYREEFREKWNEQLFSTFRRIRGTGLSDNAPLELEEYHDFLQRFEHAVINSSDRATVKARVLYYLCAAYNLFISLTPAHPVGTPFPGGFRVVVFDGEYFCPVKDKQKDVFEAICRFCVAKQMNID